MELRHLTYFDKIAQVGSVNKAAAALHMTQPSLSRQISELERELGCPLFDRTPRGVVLTSAGTGLRSHLERIFAQLERIPEVVRIASQKQELVRVGIPPGVPHYWFMDVLRAAEDRLPSASISLHEASSDEQRQLLRNGLIDLGLLHDEPPEFSSAQVLTQDLGVAVTDGSPLGSRQFIQFADLDGLKVMAHAAGEIASEEARLRSAAAAAGVFTHWIFRKFSEHSELITVSSKADAALMTEASALRNLPGWKWIPIKEENSSGKKLAVVTWAAWNEPEQPIMRDLVALMQAAKTR
ncbi:MAG: LysR family transcriptional regulator [Lacisediminihabitans sp.]